MLGPVQEDSIEAISKRAEVEEKPISEESKHIEPDLPNSSKVSVGKCKKRSFEESGLADDSSEANLRNIANAD